MHFSFILWLTKNKVENKPLEERRRILKLHLVENIVLLTIAGMVNAAYNDHQRYTALHIWSFGSSFNIRRIQDFVTFIWSYSRYCLFTDPSFIRYCIIFCRGSACRPSDNEKKLSPKKVNLWLRRFVTRFINVIPTTICDPARS